MAGKRGFNEGRTRGLPSAAPKYCPHPHPLSSCWMDMFGYAISNSSAIASLRLSVLRIITKSEWTLPGLLDKCSRTAHLPYAKGI